MAVTPDTLHPAALRLYEQVRHLEVADPDRAYDPATEGWPWATLCAALAKPLEALWDVVMAGERPWTALFDADTAPTWALPYVGNYAGVRFPPNVPEDRWRLRLQSTDGQNRGTDSAIIGAARQHLPLGDLATVTLETRLGGDAYRLRLVTYAAQTPADAEAAIRRDLATETIIPAGRVWDYVVLQGALYGWQERGAAAGGPATYGQAESLYGSYGMAEQAIPPAS